MKVKTVINSKGEQMKSQIEIPLEGSGGELGKQAVMNLISLTDGLKNMKTVQDVAMHYYIIFGFAMCCQSCGFLTEKSTDDFLQMVDHLASNELVRAGEEAKGGQA